MKKRVVGPKGQVVIPKEIREEIGLREGDEVIVELRGDEIVIRKISPPTESYTEYYIKTHSQKLEKEINVEKLLEEERIERIGLS